MHLQPIVTTAVSLFLLLSNNQIIRHATASASSSVDLSITGRITTDSSSNSKEYITYSTSATGQKICTVIAQGNNQDDTPNILHAFSECAQNAIVVFPEQESYWIASRLNPYVSPSLFFSLSPSLFYMYTLISRFLKVFCGSFFFFFLLPIPSLFWEILYCSAFCRFYILI
jgi:hypothetical protein